MKQRPPEAKASPAGVLFTREQCRDAGLEDEDVEILAEKLAAEPAVEAALLIGSRARGSHRPHSDIDLVIKGPGVRLGTAARLRGLLEESNLPMPVDVSRVTPHTDPAFAEQVHRWGRPFYRRSSVASTLPG